MKKIALALVSLVVLLIVGVVVVLLTFDPNEYKPDIVDALSKQTGRTVKLDGPISLHVSSQGLTFGIEQASFGNPSWASRPVMASIGEFDLGVALLPLLHHQVQVKGIKIIKADIQMETSASGQNNWDLSTAKSAPAQKAPEKASASAPIAIDVASVLVEDSHIAMRDKDGKVSHFNMKKLTLVHEGNGFKLDLSSDMNGTDVDASVKLGMTNLMTDKKFPIDAVVNYANYKVAFAGPVDLDAKQAAFGKVKISAGSTGIAGAFSVKWGGARPLINGELNSTKLNPNDLKPAVADPKTGKGEDAPAAASGRAFSTAPLALDGLKAADAHLKVKFDEVVTDKATIKNVVGTVDLVGGVLKVDFPAMLIAGGTVDFKTVLNAANAPAHLDLSLSAPNIETAEFMPMLGIGGFLSTKADTVVVLASSGNSLHDLASHANGTISVISGGGKVVTDKLDPLLVNLVTGGQSSNSVGLTCMAARFKVQEGVMADNGILADTTVTTVLAKGNVNLGSESNDLLVYAKPRTGNIAGFIPPVHVGGSLLQPSFGVKAGGIINSVASSLLSGGKITGVASPVPTVTAPAGQNPCVYTLDHPPAPQAPVTAVPAGGINLNQKPKDLGKALLKGFLGQ